MSGDNDKIKRYARGTQTNRLSILYSKIQQQNIKFKKANAPKIPKSTNIENQILSAPSNMELLGFISSHINILPFPIIGESRNEGKQHSHCIILKLALLPPLYFDVSELIIESIT